MNNAKIAKELRNFSKNICYCESALISAKKKYYIDQEQKQTIDRYLRGTQNSTDHIRLFEIAYKIEKENNMSKKQIDTPKISPGQIWRSKNTKHCILVASKAKDGWYYVHPGCKTKSQHKMQAHSFHFYELVNDAPIK